LDNGPHDLDKEKGMPGLQSIDGLASNLNTTSIVQALMSYERRSVNLMEANKLEKTNQMSVFNTISAKLVALKTQATSLKNVATFDAAQVTVSDEDYLSAAVNGQVAEGQYHIMIEQLATNHQIASQGFESETATLGTGTFAFQVGDASQTEITIDSDNNTLAGLRDAINKANAGVKAAIINDGSSSSSYRLLLTAEESGAENQIVVTTSLSGGNAPDFESSSFDAPETIRWNSSSTSTIALGTGAEYDGSANKTYTFTVQGSGLKTIGTDSITVNWSDGTESGSIEIPSDYVAGAEIALTGDGADGLTLAFAAGTLNGGDTFQVQTFSPLLQAAQDAKISLGNTSGGGSPISVTSDDNIIDNLIPGVTLNLKKVTDSSITVSTAIDVDGIVGKVEAFINTYNDVMSAIDDQFEYDQDSGKVGLLFGDSTLLTIQNRVKSTLQTRLTDVDGDYKLLSQLGIRHDSLGKLSVTDSAALREAISENLDDMVKFFTNTANSDNSKISYQSATADTNMPADGFEVNITQAASHGYLKGTAIADPSVNPIVIDETNYKLKFRVDGIISDEIALTQKTYNSLAELAAEIQSKIDADSKIGDRDVDVEYFDLGDTGYLQIKSSLYGSDSKVEIQAGVDSSAFTLLGLAQAEIIAGLDVEGTINGEEAEGHGQILTGKEGNTYSDGFALKVELESGDLNDDDPEATVTLVKGFATTIDDLLDMYTALGDGVISNRVESLRHQIDAIDKNIANEEKRLAIREESLYAQYLALEEALAQWNSTASTLESLFSNANANWRYMGNSNSQR
jgi:flagellar hook-associated protein 2